MATKEFRELSQKKYYVSERLPEIKQDLLRLGAESKQLKAALETGGEDKKAIAEIRRRRSYLAARSGHLKEEREALKTELASVEGELKPLQVERRKSKAKAK